MHDPHLQASKHNARVQWRDANNSMRQVGLWSTKITSGLAFVVNGGKPAGWQIDCQRVASLLSTFLSLLCLSCNYFAWQVCILAGGTSPLPWPLQTHHFRRKQNHINDANQAVAMLFLVHGVL